MLKIESFKLGSAYNYVANPTQTGLLGFCLLSNILVQTNPTVVGESIFYKGSVTATTDIEYGEVGIYDNGGRLLAIKVLPTLKQLSRDEEIVIQVEQFTYMGEERLEITINPNIDSEEE